MGTFEQFHLKRSNNQRNLLYPLTFHFLPPLALAMPPTALHFSATLLISSFFSCPFIVFVLIIFLWLSSVEICNTLFRFVSFIYYLVIFFLPCVYCVVVSFVVIIHKK